MVPYLVGFGVVAILLLAGINLALARKASRIETHDGLVDNTEHLREERVPVSNENEPDDQVIAAPEIKDNNIGEEANHTSGEDREQGEELLADEEPMPPAPLLGNDAQIREELEKLVNEVLGNRDAAADSPNEQETPIWEPDYSLYGAASSIAEDSRADEAYINSTSAVKPEMSSTGYGETVTRERDTIQTAESDEVDDFSPSSTGIDAFPGSGDAALWESHTTTGMDAYDAKSFVVYNASEPWGAEWMELFGSLQSGPGLLGWIAWKGDRPIAGMEAYDRVLLERVHGLIRAVDQLAEVTNMDTPRSLMLGATAGMLWLTDLKIGLRLVLFLQGEEPLREHIHALKGRNVL